MKAFNAFSLLFYVVFLLGTAQAQVPHDVSVKEILEKEEQQEQPLTPVDLASQDSSIPQDPYNRGTPKSTMYGFLQAARTNDFELASQYLDFRNIKASTLAIGKVELTKQLFVVLNRTLWVDIDNLSVDYYGHANDKLPSYRDLLGTITHKKHNIDLYLQRVPRSSDQVTVWKISNATVAKIPFLSEEFAYTPFGEWLAENTPEVSFLGVMLWQWLYFLLLLVFYFLIAKVITWLVSKTLKHIYPSISTSTQKFIENPVALVLAVILARSLFAKANVTLAVRAVAEGNTLLTLAWIWLIFSFIDLMKLKLSDRFVEQGKPLAVYLLRPAGTVLKSLIVVFALLIWFENLGFNATTLLAGLGIGGLAIALAAQKTVENIIGAITLYTSAPVRIGNFCRFGEQLGVVEEIGLRATRIRTLDRTVIYIANAQFVDLHIENYSERERIAYRPKLLLSNDCQQDNISALLADITELLNEHKDVAEKPVRAHFKAFTKHGLALDILSYIETTDFDQYLQVTNQLNLAILALVRKHHCSLVTSAAMVDIAAS
ncbi:mechanosensitive ion channel family protein [Thalassotalea sp. PLHSN55]|uniref:mechanosensitive ion channel family protein n=1 Tax=Thalassotalea sp. PLHSN55 TaxID=3435888 RepID=UPI003F845756